MGTGCPSDPFFEPRLDATPEPWPQPLAERDKIRPTSIGIHHIVAWDDESRVEPFRYSVSDEVGERRQPVMQVVGCHVEQMSQYYRQKEGMKKYCCQGYDPNG